MIFRHVRNIRGFFSDYFLGTVFGKTGGRGKKKTLSDADTDFAYRRFRRICENAGSALLDPAECREKYIRPLLRDALGFHLGVGEERIHGLFQNAEEEQARLEAAQKSPLLICYCGATDEDFDAGRGLKSASRRFEKALASSGVPYGFLVSGERIRLVRAPGEGTRGACLEIDLAALSDDPDPESFAAFFRLFHLGQFTSREDGTLPIRSIEEESRKHAETVSDDLKRAVFTAAETLTAAILDNQVGSSQREVVEESLRTYRDAALTTLYRILFILYAEARDERLQKHGLYQSAYSVHGLIDDLLRNPLAELPANRFGIWARLKALFKIYDSGLPRIADWDNIPPRGGDFFSETTPIGEILVTASLPDLLIARVLLDLTTTSPRRGVGRERVSFRELDIENLGAVYEGLLEYEPRIARELTLEVSLSKRIYVLPPSEVLRLREEKDLRLKGDPALLEHLKLTTATDESLSGEEETEPTGADEPPPEEESADDPDDDTEKVKKGAALHVLRAFDSGDFHFVLGAGRKGSGSFYTPLLLVRDLVVHTLGPLVAGKSSAEIERLRVLDPSCGSAHFLVEALRFLGQALHAAYSAESGTRGPEAFRATTEAGWDKDWKASDEEARSANSEARAWCKRRIAERCLFGVDLNPTAVNLARVALWIESLAGDRPLTFFEHHFRCGNSLMGTWLDRLDNLSTVGKMAGLPGAPAPSLFGDFAVKAVQQAAETRRLIDCADTAALASEGIDPESIKELQFKEHQLHEAEGILKGAKLLCDLRSAMAFMEGALAPEWNTLFSLADEPTRLREYVEARPWYPEFVRIRDRERFFHWELEFPEVFMDREHPGFDAVLGNPPWDKVKPDKKEFYGKYDVLIRQLKGAELEKRIAEIQAAHPGLEDEFVIYADRLRKIAFNLKNRGDFRFHDWEIDGQKTGGDTDIFKFFVERAWKVVGPNGRVGLVVPSAIYNNEGCTGLRHLLLNEAKVERFYVFENKRKIFDIHSSFKFISLVFSKNDAGSAEFPAAFMRHDITELASEGPKPWMVAVRRDELERLSPGTLAFLEYRGARDREILLRMYEGRPLLGDQGDGSWNVKFYREFHLSDDRDLWSAPKTGKLWSVKGILGREPADFTETRLAMAEKGLWPLYQDAHIHQFVI